MEYTTELLDSLRLEGDPLADKVIADLVAAGQVEEVNILMRHLQTNEQPIPAELPPLVQEYLRITDNPPAWADLDRIARTHDFFLDDGLHVSAVLSLGAMVGCYAVPHGAKLLNATHRLSYPQRRIAETGQFVFYMMSDRAFKAGGEFIPAVQKVRLVHAGVRYFLSFDAARWDKSAHGVPICQEDLLGALMLFSVQVLKGLKLIGTNVTRQEQEDYYYVWRVVGSMLGIREDIIPESLDDAYTLNEILIKRHLGPSEEGKQLTRDLIEMYEHMIPGKVFDGLAPALVRYVVEDEIADMMEVPRSNWDKVAAFFPKVANVVEKVEDHFAPARLILDRAAWLLLNGQIRTFSGGEKMGYTIPADLKEGWEKRSLIDND
jgi:hypothetical protein